MIVVIFIVICFICVYLKIEAEEAEERKKIEAERRRKQEELYGEVIEFLELKNLEEDLKEVDDYVIVKSRSALENYGFLKYIKEKDNFDTIKNIVEKRKNIKMKIQDFLKNNKFCDREQYSFVSTKLKNYLKNADGYKIIVKYVTSAGNYKEGVKMWLSEDNIVEIESHPEWLMTKAEYKNFLKEKVENKKNEFCDRINKLIDFAYDTKYDLIVKKRAKSIDELVQRLFDSTVNKIQKIKEIDCAEWSVIDGYISNIESQIYKIIEDDKKISSYYESDEFKKIKETCNALNLSRKEFNEYIEEKTESISKLFGTRVVRNETQNSDSYNYIRAYKKSITPFTAEVSANVFSSAENNPIKYIIKYFYPNKSQYKEHAQKLRTLLEELETLKEAKTIIQNYKMDYNKYIKNVPEYVLKDDEDGFYSRLGLAIIDEAILNVEYKFVYTSNGGMAQRSFTIPMNEDNIIELINALESKLSKAALAKEQRAMMTAKLRKFIKKRDNFTCCRCNNSVFKEPNLLLEIDHIIPIAKGGLTKVDNLQTLCWKCNRSKGAKLIS